MGTAELVGCLRDVVARGGGAREGRWLTASRDSHFEVDDAEQDWTYDAVCTRMYVRQRGP